MDEQKSSFTGRTRQRKTKASVKAANTVARHVITLGGIGTIISVIMVAVFLVYVVIPLFIPPSLPHQKNMQISSGSLSRNIIEFRADEYLSMTYALYEDGTLVVSDLLEGDIIYQRQMFEDNIPTCAAFLIGDPGCVFGFENGIVVLGEMEFEPEFLSRDNVPLEYQDMDIGDRRLFEDGIVEVTPEGQFRTQKLRIRMEEPIQLNTTADVEKIDISRTTSGEIFSALTSDGLLRIERVSRRENLLTGEITITTTEGSALVDTLHGRPDWIQISGLGDAVYVIWKDGRLDRYDSRDINNIALTEENIRLVDEGVEVTVAEFMLGKSTLIVGDNQGNVNAWFRINTEEEYGTDNSRLTLAHRLPAGDAAVVSLSSSSRTRKIAAGFADGTAALYYVTNDSLLARNSVPGITMPIQGITIAPKEDFLLGLAGTTKAMWRIDAPHPESTMAAIFAPVWYEGYPEPEHVWQTSSGTDDFEPKYGMIPLIFGTLKATIYSMLFGAPLALLAAVYTSEFLNPRFKTYIKPGIEMMASLPSVVLGFLAGIVIAPMVEDIVPQAIASILTIPFALLLGAYLWQLLPNRPSILLQRFRLWFILATIPLGIWLATVVGPFWEDIFMEGDIKSWLDSQIGNGLGAWMLMFIPLSALLISFVITNYVNPMIRRISGGWSRRQFALFDMVKFLAGFALMLLLALMLSGILTAFGLDPRGSYIDTYVQRNAMVVGFIMGFAIIPIIYTIAEDALSAVPEHLRAGSLGAGATPWQTATRIIIPTAMSGLFSALMIGLGRAVGETMIVLMAAGNTPVMDWNIFNGFRTLSANIAVELPEAVQNSTHYRALFLAALVLFIMTFAVNTVAELVRQTFRKRSSQL